MIYIHTHTHPFNGPFSVTTRVSQYQKGKTNLDFTEARDSEWQWHQLGHMQVCTSLQTDNHASTPPLGFFTGRMPFLPPNQQRQSTEGMHDIHTYIVIQNLLKYTLVRRTQDACDSVPADVLCGSTSDTIQQKSVLQYLLTTITSINPRQNTTLSSI